MDFVLSAEHQKIQQVCRKLAEDFATRAGQHDRETSLPVENYEALKREGLCRLTVPKELGGWGAGYLGHTLAMEELAQGCASTALSFNMHSAFLGVALNPPIGDTVSPAVRQRLARLAVEEQKLVAAGLSEPGVSSLLLGPTYSLSMQIRRVAG
jgi:alkylation response protein AidB-like acyl-CoA dehydrogenase